MTIAFATLPVLALLSVPTVRGLLADMPLGRGEAITSIWLGVALGTLGTAVVGISVVPMTLALGRRRPWLLVDFLERGVRVALVGLAVLVACEAVLASGLALILEQLLFGRAFAGTVAVTMIGGFVGLFYLLRTAIEYPSPAVEMTAIEIDPRREPALETMYRDLAARLSIAPPDHVVIGPEIRFAITRAPVVLDDRTLVGTTLYLSWPLLRVLSSDQTAAVVAHELAHIAGSHLETGRRLDRGMGRLREAADRLDTEVYDNAFARIATQPAAIWLRHIFIAIRGVLAVQQQPDELEADRMAAGLVGADVLGDALVTYTAAEALWLVWNYLLSDPRAIMHARGKPPTEPFATAVDELLSSENLDELLAAGHSMTTHPPAAERLRMIGVVPTPAVARDPALTTLITGSREIASALSRRMREGPNMIRDDVINPIRFEAGVAGLLVVVGLLGVFTLLVALSDDASRIRANAMMWGMILTVVIGVAGVTYVGLQQEVVIDEGGVSATGWFRRLLGRRSRVVPWSSISGATLGRARSINVATGAGSLEVYGTWLNDRDIRRIVEGLRSHGVPIRFKLGARGFDDERRAVIWLIGDAFLVPTLRRTDDGRIVETEPVHEVGLRPEALFNFIARELGARPKAMGRRARPVDVSVSRAVGRRRRIVIAGSSNHSTVRIDGFEDHWWEDSPPDAARIVALIWDVFELELPDGEDAEINR